MQTDLTVSELQQRRDATAADAKRLLTTAERGNRDMSKDEADKFNELSRQVEIFDARVERLLTVKAMNPPPGRTTRPPQIGSPYADPRRANGFDSNRVNGTSDDGLIRFRDVKTGNSVFGFAGTGPASVAAHLTQGTQFTDAFAEPGAIGRWCQYVA